MLLSKRYRPALIPVIIQTVIFCCIATESFSQALLNRPISVYIERQPLYDALEIIGNQGGFYFSYNSNIIQRDSLVSLSVTNKPLRQVLELLFPSGYGYRVSGNYIILRRLIPAAPSSSGDTLRTPNVVKGVVVNLETGEAVPNASVYERSQLHAALTNSNGSFALKVNNADEPVYVSVSKEFYEDTTIFVQPKLNNRVTIGIMPSGFETQPVTLSPTGVGKRDSTMLQYSLNANGPPMYLDISSNQDVEKTFLGKLMLSSRQKIQSLNLHKFFTIRNAQFSLVPGFGSNGKLGSQVVNHFSFNLLGGYTGGVNGVEVGGLFNMNRKGMRYIQVGGLMNMVGGQAHGIQIAGVNNTVLDSAGGMQVAGMGNMVTGSFRGLQVGGFFNMVARDVRGVQLSGFANIAWHDVHGVQFAPNLNVAVGDLRGVQVSTVNLARRMKGVQIGFINIADTSEGYSIGLINIIRKGYHSLSIGSNETTPLEYGFKTGNRHLYSIFTWGLNPDKHNKLYSFGYGIGSDFMFGKRFAINPEITASNLYLGNWDDTHVLLRTALHANFRFRKWLSVYAGPSFVFYYSDGNPASEGYKSVLPQEGYHHFSLWNKNWTGWFGWSIGVNIF